MTWTWKEKLYSFFLLVVLGLAFPIAVMNFVFNSVTFDNICVFMAHKLFLQNYGIEYEGFFTYLVSNFMTPLGVAFALCSLPVIPFIVPHSLLKGASIKLTLVVFGVSIFGILFTVFAIPAMHYPDIIKDYGCVKRGEIKQISSENYAISIRKERGGRHNAKRSVYYLYFSETEENPRGKSFKIGRDLYEYLRSRPTREKITLSYMPNTGVFLNIQIGDKKFGAYADGESP